jgi:hypothetical protein
VHPAAGMRHHLRLAGPGKRFGHQRRPDPSKRRQLRRRGPHGGDGRPHRLHGHLGRHDLHDDGRLRRNRLLAELRRGSHADGHPMPVRRRRYAGHLDGAGGLTAPQALPGWLPQAFLSLGAVRGSG